MKQIDYKIWKQKVKQHMRRDNVQKDLTKGWHRKWVMTVSEKRVLMGSEGGEWWQRAREDSSESEWERRAAMASKRGKWWQLVWCVKKLWQLVLQVILFTGNIK